MSFGNLLDPDKIENGVWVQVDSPTDGEPMFLNGDEKLPQRVKVRSTACKAYADWLEAKQRKSLSKMVGGATKKTHARIAADGAKDDDHEKFAILLAGIENEERPGVVTPSPDELKAYGQRPEVKWLVKFVLGVAEDDSQYGKVADVEKPAPATESIS